MLILRLWSTIDSGAPTVVPSFAVTVPDPPASMAVNPSTNASSVYQSAAEVYSNVSTSGLASSDPQPNSSLVDWDFNEALAWFHASS
jgi:hypothetical protein